MTTEAVNMSVTTQEAPTGVRVTTVTPSRQMDSAAHSHTLVRFQAISEERLVINNFHISTVVV